MFLFSYPISASPLLQPRALANGVNLRILPLGDSITFGSHSSDGNGYRQDLRNDIGSGNNVTFVGTVSSGNMTNPQNEGHSGAVISQIASYGQKAYGFHPNVVLLMAGTNDINKNQDPANAPGRLSSLIDQINAACSDAVVIVAQITPIANSTADARARTFNAALPNITNQKVSAGKHVLLVDMHSALLTSDLSDGLHPNDRGYAKMANVWLGGLQKAAGKGWITKPVAGG